MTENERLPYYGVYETLMRLPSMQERQGGAMVLAADIYKLVRAATCKDIGEWLEKHVGLNFLKADKYQEFIATLKSGKMPG